MYEKEHAVATYHAGELAVQERAGLALRAASALRAVRAEVPPVARQFLAERPLIVVGAADPGGRLWATHLTGEPGFLRVPDPRSLVIDALPVPEDPLAGVLGAARSLPVGMIAIEPATRRRMRINGRADRDGTGLRVTLDQVVSNCPKYIQQRDHRPADADGPVLRRATTGRALDAAQRAAVGRADTFFVTTASDTGHVDASHRGGNPGFVQVLSATLLRWPDYTGNAMFLTLGNLHVNPAAGILVPDWETGTALHLSGTARTVWDAEEIARTPGAQRLVEFCVEAVHEVSGASPLRWGEPGYSRYNPPVR
ncbi:putative ferredoxin NADPH reductase [Streptomyces ambofaciens ATCC 23877]|uniref:Putative ferredoxin NADPH reductase n=1 Tax=Streptomyces ambofaciens (strain ATCC 23877 / 3486 / DSM 40053 / JCM 4204 / NBRC 12836 / NRRL B-2516) TaxID=278992 RepID=Q1RR76_STRA7|nr:putative ferredoxin NADPH reductase [Streptomyces ambofaciens ATCC 23877]AKZ60697.1 putative ferredoxin NADPH reductase [Streptomyces ambofaciens ATCC 23877]CAI77938.1 putative ferredoxin NADPH reductase [Streptomyces ambofaciens ATCC 23877]CAI78212.1 putative ferredoxin NADPH reductase [Streptomyces ambofaciens ATCC 23877]CAJ87718.1 putative ferredoxin NADPH reductase [Streptomyces ambofaciens ATCC 23877]